MKLTYCSLCAGASLNHDAVAMETGDTHHDKTTDNVCPLQTGQEQVPHEMKPYTDIAFVKISITPITIFVQTLWKQIKQLFPVSSET